MSTFYREGRVGRACWISLAMFVVLATFAGPATGQGTGRQIPSARYGIVFGEFYEGEYKDALKDFQSEGRGAIKLGLSRWVDSICYHTMIGECYYHMGQLPDALQHYTAACNLYAEYGDWMTRVQFPATIRPSPRQIVIPWGQNTRGTVPGHFSTSMLIARGRLNNNDVVRQGGVVEQLKFWQINVQEIVRCTSLAMRRRAELMGPVGYGDPLTANLVALLSRRPAPPNHWSQSWIDVQLGIALAAAGKGEEAAQYLKRGSVTAGSFDHPLTGAALLVLGHVTLEKALAEKDPNLYASALKSFENAAYSAAIFSDVDVLEEAFRYAALTHLLTNRKTVYAPLAAAARWA
ncbi:MAG: hypothetical protein HQ581_17855, partial [Planctomycetes bacterium]|nr:hypothetical protein [Planctomycetota bacterium]